MIVPDVNLLMHAYNSDSPVHDRVRRWWEGLTTDSHLATLAIEHQAELHSSDADFARFSGLRWHNPLVKHAGVYRVELARGERQIRRIARRCSRHGPTAV